MIVALKRGASPEKEKGMLLRLRKLPVRLPLREEREGFTGR